jgi:8-oxo-dGTP diphosphatase
VRNIRFCRDIALRRYKIAEANFVCVGSEVARMPVMAAGGIVMRREQPPLIAVVRLRKRDEWVLPKGKLDDGETARAAARREVLEETGHNVTVHEFLGTLVYESGGRSKIVHYWRMEAGGTQARALMSDIRAVDWLPLDAAIARLSRAHERTFLENVGPLAVSVLSRRLKARAEAASKPPAAARTEVTKKRRIKPPAVTPQLPLAEPVVEPSAPIASPPEPVVDHRLTAELPPQSAAPEKVLPLVEAEFILQAQMPESEAASANAEPSSNAPDDNDRPDPNSPERRTFAQKVRSWLRRAA